MRKLTKTISFSFIILAGLACCKLLFQHQSETTFAVNQRNLTNIGIFVKFADSNDIVPTNSDGTKIHLDDEQGINNANLLLNSDSPVETEIFSNGTSASSLSVPSVKKYYETQSYGRLSIKTELFPKQNQTVISYQDPHPMSYYLPKSASNPNGYDDSNRTAREYELVNSAINDVAQQIETSGLTRSMLDTNNDSKIDAVTLFIESADTTKAIVAPNTLLWSHVHKNSNDITAKIFGLEISAHAILYGDNYTEQTGIFSLQNSGYGVIIHELGHILGFTDLYRISDSINTGKPVEYYDVMGRASSSNPQNFLAYFTSEYYAETNWHDPLPVINQTTTSITLSKPNFTNPSEKRAVKIQKSPTDREYFIAEYYEPHDERDGYSGKTKGVIIYRVNENNKTTGNYNNDVSGQSDHIFIFRPNEPTLGASAGDLEHAALSTARPTLGKPLSNNSDFDNETIYYADGSNSGLIITVTNQTESTITINITFPDISGSGTIDNPYLISDVTTFLYLMNGDTTGKYYKLVNDLDFQNVTYPTLNFYGHLDGNSKTLNNISATATGAFNNIGDYNKPSSVKNLKIKNLTISPTTGNNHLGGLTSTIQNATISYVELLSGSVTNVAPTFGIDTVSTGGLAGSVAEDVVIDHCASAVAVASPQNAGGLIGLNQNSQISNSHASGKVTGSNHAGTFIGLQYSNNDSYSIPVNSTYDHTINPDLPTIGGFYIASSFQFQTPPADLLQSITAKTTEPETPPVILPTEAETLQKLGLTKKGQYLFGFNPDTNFATGREYTFKIGEITYRYTIVIKGDVNGDGKIQATDYVKIRNHIMGKATLTGASLQAADINQDSKIQATDYVRVRNHIMGKTAITQR